MELVLELDSDAHSLEDEDVSLRTDTDAGDINTNYTHCGQTVHTVNLLYV